MLAVLRMAGVPSDMMPMLRYLNRVYLSPGK